MMNTDIYMKADFPFMPVFVVKWIGYYVTAVPKASLILDFDPVLLTPYN